MRRSSHGLTSALSPIVGMGEGLEHAPGTLRRLYKGENTGKFRHSVACGKRPSQRTGEIASAPLLSGTNKQEIADQVCDLLDMRAGKGVISGDELIFGRQRKRRGRDADGAIMQLTGVARPDHA
jgi:hypothetical protein